MTDDFLRLLAEAHRATLACKLRAQYEDDLKNVQRQRLDDCFQTLDDLRYAVELRHIKGKVK